MPHIQTKCFGELDYSPDAVFEFPHGLPGFEAEHAFVFLEQPATHPLMFMQSLSRQDVCFILLPVLAAERHYKLCLSEEDLYALRLPAGSQPQMGKDILCAVMVCGADDRRPHPTANLFAPIVANLQQKTGIQAIQTEYSPRHPLLSRDCQEELVAC
jgi:flagellar assembly factor FliW